MRGKLGPFIEEKCKVEYSREMFWILSIFLMISFLRVHWKSQLLIIAEKEKHWGWFTKTWVRKICAFITVPLLFSSFFVLKEQNTGRKFSGLWKHFTPFHMWTFGAHLFYLNVSS